jgi:hypothetical protein
MSVSDHYRMGRHITVEGRTMPQFNEADWKLFRARLPGWQEAYMERLNREYAAILAGSGKASEKFWALEERINRDKSTVGVTARMSRSNMDYNIAGLLGGGVITLANLNGFSEELQESMRLFMEKENGI